MPETTTQAPQKRRPMMRRRKPLYHSIEDCHEPMLREQDDNGGN